MLAGARRPFSLSAALCFRGRPDVAVLESALAEVVARHEILRAAFGQDVDGAFVRLADSLHGHLSMRLVPPTVAAADRIDAGLRLMADALSPHFDVGEPPLVRAVVVRVDDEQVLFGLVLDHVLADGWSMEILVRDLVRLYVAGAAKEDPDLPPLPVQFVDFAAWERKHLTGRVFERHLSYWRDKLADCAAIPPSHLIDPGAPGGDVAAAALREELAPSVVKQLEQLADVLGCGMTPVVAAALKAAVLRQRTPDQPTGVGFMASAANRLYPELSDVVGYFATPVVLYTDLSGNPTMSELLAREAATFLQALRHQGFPHALVLKHLSPELYGARHRERVLHGEPYVQFEVAEQSRTEHPLSTRADVTVRRIRPPSTLPAPGGGLRFLGTHTPGTGLRLELRHRTDLYRSDWVRSLLGAVPVVLGAMVDRPDARLNEVLPARGGEPR